MLLRNHRAAGALFFFQRDAQLLTAQKLVDNSHGFDREPLPLNMALILANLRLSGKAPISRGSKKIDAKGKAIRDEASLRKRDGITPVRLFLSLAIAFVTSPGVTFLNLNSFCSFRHF